MKNRKLRVLHLYCDTFTFIWRVFREVLGNFFIPDDQVISKESQKRLSHPRDRKILLAAYDDLRKQRYAGVEEPTVTITYSDGETVTIFSVGGTTILN